MPRNATRWLLPLTLLAAPAAGAKPPKADDTAAALKLFTANCKPCHGADGKGATDLGRRLAVPDLSSAALLEQRTDEQLRRRISVGFKEVTDGGLREMPGFADDLSPQQINLLVRYLRGLKAGP